MKLYYLLDCSPMVEDYTEFYSRIRFYSDTIVKFCKYLKVDTLTIVYPSFIGAYSDRPSYNVSTLSLIKNKPLSEFENCDYLVQRLTEHNITTEFVTYEEVTNVNKNDVAIFGLFIARDFQLFEERLKLYKTIIDKVDRYYYLESDDPLSSNYYLSEYSFIKRFKSLYNTEYQVFVDKLAKIITTESTVTSFSEIKDLGIDINKIAYLPIVIDYNNRKNPNAIRSIHKPDKVMILSRLNSYLSNPMLVDLFNKYSDRIDLYDSYITPYIQLFSNLLFKQAKFYTINEMNCLLQNYRYMIGAGDANNHRFTYKVVETTANNTLCLFPEVSLDNFIELDSSYEFSKKLYNKYKNYIGQFNIDYLTQVFENKIDYTQVLKVQNKFVKEYFDLNSKHINLLVNKIFN